MSHTATTWAWKQNIPYKPKFVLLAMADWYNELESCAWPTHQQLCDKTGMSKSSVRRGIDWLIDHKLVVVEARFKNSRQLGNRYLLPVNVLVLQGVLPEQGGVLIEQGGALPEQGGALIEQPIKDTVIDTVKDTKDSGEPQETDLNIDEVLSGKGKNKDQIFSALKYKDGILTPKSCGDLFRDCRANAGDNGFGAELLVKHYKMLQNAHKRVGDEFPQIVWDVMSKWIAFTKHAQKVEGAFPLPSNPTVKFFCLYVEAAASFSSNVSTDDDEGFVHLIAKTVKPLTKPSGTDDNVEEAISTEELLAMSKEIHK